jgi:hypothetical protein
MFFCIFVSITVPGICVHLEHCSFACLHASSLHCSFKNYLNFRLAVLELTEKRHLQEKYDISAALENNQNQLRTLLAKE